MRAIVQRALESSVTINSSEEKTKREIKKGFVVLFGTTHGDTEEEVKQICDKIEKMRIFEDENGKMNLSLDQVGGEILFISQFTLYADCSKGNRPSFVNAGAPDEAEKLYNFAVEYLRSKNLTVKTGEFGADMLVNIQNDGPVTIILDTEHLKRKK